MITTEKRNPWWIENSFGHAILTTVGGLMVAHVSRGTLFGEPMVFAPTATGATVHSEVDYCGATVARCYNLGLADSA